MNIRAEKPEDIEKIWRINATAFETEAEANLVNLLRDNTSTYISLVYEKNDELVGHIFFSPVNFLNDIYESYGTRQIVMEMKNVKAIKGAHINQLNRYLTSDFGRFGVLVTRSPLPRAMFRNTLDLWAGQRRCIIALTDEDVQMMVDVFETKQRKPIEVLKKKVVEFDRSCPA